MDLELFISVILRFSPAKSGRASDKDRFHGGSVISFLFLNVVIPGPEVIKLFSCSTQLSMKF